jgi:hypothetical protein
VRPAALATLALLALAGCDPQRVEESESEEVRFEAGSGPPRIEVDIDEGSIEIEGVANARAIEGEFVKRARSVDRDAARHLLARIETFASAEGGRIRLEGRVEDVPPFGGDLETDLVLRVPRESELQLSTGDGRIHVRGIEGRVRAESGDGRIEVEDASGELRLRTEDGAIAGTGLDASVEAESGDGSIELEGRFPRLRATTSDGSIRVDCREWREPTEGWTLRTGDGAIRVLLPSSAAADIDATASDGRIVNRLSRFESEARVESESRLRGKLAGGGPLLFLSTMDGRIELEEN